MADGVAGVLVQINIRRHLPTTKKIPQRRMKEKDNSVPMRCILADVSPRPAPTSTRTQTHFPFVKTGPGDFVLAGVAVIDISTLTMTRSTSR